VIIGVIASVFVAFAFSQNKIALLPDWTFYPGIALMVGASYSGSGPLRYSVGTFRC